jgi:hypothetical protein
MKLLRTFIIVIFLSGLLNSCSKKLDKLLANPNGPTTDAADVDAFFNEVQLDFNAFYNAASDFGGTLSRQQALTSGYLYENAYTPQSFDALWTTAYSGIIKHVDALIPLAESQKKYHQVGMAKIIKAYTVATLVDYFGDVPYSEANVGTSNINPKADNGQQIYVEVLTLIDSAIADLNKSQDSKTFIKTDLFYNGSASNWIAFGNSLKLKLYLQERLVFPDAASKIAELESENNLIRTSDQDFQFKYGKNLASPDTRHPHYTANYEGGGTGEYIGNQFLYTVVYGKGQGPGFDPRRRYYFYRQVGDYSAADQTTASCVTQAKPAWYLDEMPYCLAGLSIGSEVGYWGRDHGDAQGTGPDSYDVTAWGLYPAGGQFDESSFDALSSTGLGAGGKGISPIWLSSFTYFAQAEAALTLGVTTNGTARDLLDTAIRESIQKVLNFPVQISYNINQDFVPTSDAVDAYVKKVLSNYDDAANEDDRLNIIMEEYYIALWGNGIEPYNNLRRTGKPANLQYIVTTPNPGFFIRSFFYPAVYINSNTNAPAQKTPGTGVQKVFWDTNADDFIK